MAGDNDEHEDLLHSEQLPHNLGTSAFDPRARPGNTLQHAASSHQRRPLLARMRDESEVNSAEDELENGSD